MRDKLGTQSGTGHAALTMIFVLLCGSALFGQTITLSPASGPPNTLTKISGSGFTPGVVVNVYFDSTDEAAVVPVDPGIFENVTISVPASALPGAHTITATPQGGGTGASATFTVSTDWSQYGFSPHHKNFNPYENVLNAKNLNSLTINWTAGSYVLIATQPAVVNGVVYFGGTDSLYAVQATNGSTLWTYATGGYVFSSPAVANGVVYFGSWDHNVYAVDASTGVKRWSYTTGGSVQAAVTVANGVVYVGSEDHSVYALDANTGTVLWTYTTGGQVTSSPAVAYGVVYVGSWDHNVYALSAKTGAKLWKHTTGGLVSSGPAVVNGVVYVGSHDYGVYALDAKTGAKLWSYVTSGFIDSSPAVANGVVYLGSADSNFYALNASTGMELWRSSGLCLCSTPTVANGVVYVSTLYYLYGLNPSTGAQLWNSDVAQGNSPAVVNGVVYVYDSFGGQLFAFGLPKSGVAQGSLHDDLPQPDDDPIASQPAESQDSRNN
jgi:outer membrane protein assembly factor BamB